MGIVMASRRGAAMKRCAKCGETYDEAYDACPKCTKQHELEVKLRKIMWPIAAALILLGLFACWFVGSL